MTQTKTPITDTYEKFKFFAENYNSTAKISSPLLPFGVKAIDQATSIMNTDLIVIGALTGTGKTTISSLIASNAALAGNKTLLFALEAYNGEIEDRIKFDKIKQEYYSSKDFVNQQKIRFKLWKTGMYKEKRFLELEQEIINKTNEALKMNLMLRYRDKNNYFITDFKNEIEKAKVFMDIKLIVIDHLHYFSFSDDKTENKEIKSIMNTLRDIGLIYNIPIVLVSHLRKLDKYNQSLCPDLAEFHGSSEITKNATTVITMSPAVDIEQKSAILFPTYFRICKERFESGTNRYIMLTNYDINRGQYRDEYHIGKLYNNGSSVEKLDHTTKPYWASEAKIDGVFEERKKNKSHVKG